MSDLLRDSSPLGQLGVGATDTVVIHRTGDRDLEGEVALLGEGYSVGTGTTAWVYIAKRTRGGYVVAWSHLTIWDGAEDRYSAELCKDAGAVLAALQGEGGMQRAEEQAWRQACGRDGDIAAANRQAI